MVITAAHLTPIVAILAGILILIIPRLLNYIVAIYLIFVGVVQLNDTHHWVRFGMDAKTTTTVAIAADQVQRNP